MRESGITEFVELIENLEEISPEFLRAIGSNIDRIVWTPQPATSSLPSIDDPTIMMNLSATAIERSTSFDDISHSRT